MDQKELQENIERKYLQIILANLKDEQFQTDTVRKTAQIMQALRPFSDFADAKLKVEFLVQKYPFLSDMYRYLVLLEEEFNSKNIISQMHEHLKNNDIDSALQIGVNAKND